ncbi:ATP-binding protein [Thalassococcus lentus]|uniref:ATP-binding protein n=1 Tax=Thalassococcus lentus TaxID=1210524 RepID=A0ABT4XNT1_9RHOB|nr:ATP-binding protein [Thalassococcus lentus]MDA7423575.1 ATP-binding protein [Thalassococcus lentus]
MNKWDQNDPPGALRFERRIDSTSTAVSVLLCDLRNELQAANHRAGSSDTWEIVLAEAINNVVEHAYMEHAGHPVALKLVFSPVLLTAEMTDWGLPMPNLTLPEGAAPEIGETAEDQPEGGFGWHLIKALTEQLEYKRQDSTNKLLFSVKID